jgi:hypothetical protein
VKVDAEKFTFSGKSDGKTWKFEEELFAEVLPDETTKRCNGL